MTPYPSSFYQGSDGHVAIPDGVLPSPQGQELVHRYVEWAFAAGIVLVWFAATSGTMHESDGPAFFTLLLGIISTRFRDVQQVINSILQLVFYLTPIIYQAQDLGGGRVTWLMSNCNPLVPLLDLVRDPILHAL